MVRRRQQRSRRNRPSMALQKFTAGKRRPRSKRRRQPSGIGSILLNGTRTVLSALPGSGITVPIADFIFKLLGVVDSIKKADAGYSASVKSVGLFGIFEVDTSMFVASTPSIGLILPTSNKSQSSSAITSQYAISRLSHFEVVAKACGPQGRTSGSWIMAYYLYRDVDDRTLFLKDLAPNMSFERLLAFPHVQGPTLQDLRLRKYISPADGFAYQPKTWGTTLGCIMIAFQDVSRISYGPLTADDFQCVIDVTGAVVASGWHSNNSAQFSTDVVDPLSSIGAVLFQQDKDIAKTLLVHSSSNVTSSAGSTLVTGLMTDGYIGGIPSRPLSKTPGYNPFPPILTLEGMALE